MKTNTDNPSSMPLYSLALLPVGTTSEITKLFKFVLSNIHLAVMDFLDKYWAV